MRNIEIFSIIAPLVLVIFAGVVGLFSTFSTSGTGERRMVELPIVHRTVGWSEVSLATLVVLLVVAIWGALSLEGAALANGS